MMSLSEIVSEIARVIHICEVTSYTSLPTENKKFTAEDEGGSGR